MTVLDHQHAATTSGYELQAVTAAGGKASLGLDSALDG